MKTEQGTLYFVFLSGVQCSAPSHGNLVFLSFPASLPFLPVLFNLVNKIMCIKKLARNSSKLRYT